MREFIERHGPPTPKARLALSFVAALLGVPGMILTFGALVNTGIAAAVLVGIPSALLTWVAYLLASSVLRRAESAPEPEWWGGRPDDSDAGTETDPVRRLQQRYADGELTTEEFERRLDRLVESDAVRADRAADATPSGTRPSGRDSDHDSLGDREADRA